jgi:hypothetical protein
MQHCSEDDLVLHYYGELPEAAGHLVDCAECSTRFDSLKRDLDTVELPPVPEPALGYEHRVWQKLQPKIRPKIRPERARPRFWLPVAAAAAIAVASFSLGRWTQPLAPVEDGKAVRERVLIVAVGDHLERSQMVIAELVNAKPGEKLTTERDLAESLVGPNRLYRQTATATGDTATAALLEDIERVLLEVAHAPEEARSEQVQRLRERIEQQGLMFRIRVTESQLQQRIGLPDQAGRVL